MPSPYGAGGRVKRNVAPASELSANQIRSWCAAITIRQNASPRPLPLQTDFVASNGASPLSKRPNSKIALTRFNMRCVELSRISKQKQRKGQQEVVIGGVDPENDTMVANG